MQKPYNLIWGYISPAIRCHKGVYFIYVKNIGCECSGLQAHLNAIKDLETGALIENRCYI